MICIDPYFCLSGSGRLWFDREQIERDLLDDVTPPPEEMLWRVRVVSASAELDTGTAWLFTTGLLRCGLPELEILEVPASRAQEAANMLDLVAALILETGAPAPEVPMALGEGINVVLVPWQAAVEVLGTDSLGSAEDRSHLAEATPNPLLSTRAAICDVELRGMYKQVRAWPEHALDLMAMVDAAVYASTRSSKRNSVIARNTWPNILEAVHIDVEGQMVVFVEMPIATNEDGINEHGWIQVDDARNDGGSGRLLRDDGQGREQGTKIDFEISDIIAWRLLKGEETVGSSDGIDPVTFAKGD